MNTRSNTTTQVGHQLNTTETSSKGAKTNSSKVPTTPATPNIVNPYNTPNKVTPSKRPGPPLPPTLKKPRMMFLDEKSIFRGAVHVFTTCNNGDATCQLQIALVTKHYNSNLTYFMPEMRETSGATQFLKFCAHHKYCDRRNLLQYIAVKVKSFVEGTDTPLQSNDQLHSNFVAFIGKLQEDEVGQASICPPTTPKQWGTKLADTLQEFLNKEFKTSRSQRRWEVPDFDIHIEKTKYSLSRFFYDEDLWNILHLLWDVDDKDVFRQLLEHDATLEMIYGKITDEHNKLHMQTQLENLRKAALEKETDE
jgi:hypothetical protein